MPFPAVQPHGQRSNSEAAADREHGNEDIDLLAEHGVGAGLALAAFGVWAVVDLNRPAALLATALEAPEAMTPEAMTVVTVLAVCLAWLQMRREPEGETL